MWSGDYEEKGDDHEEHSDDYKGWGKQLTKGSLCKSHVTKALQAFTIKSNNKYKARLHLHNRSFLENIWRRMS